MSCNTSMGVAQERKFLMNTLSGFTAADAEYVPADGMMNVAQQINHIANTIAWFQEGLFGSGFVMDFEKLERMNFEPVTYEQAMANLDAAYEAFMAKIDEVGDEGMMAPMAPNEIFGPLPRAVGLAANTDHTAHHRGALAVYLRLLGRVPKMPYID